MGYENEVISRSISVYPCLGLCNPSYCKKGCIDFITIQRQKQINQKLLKSNNNQIRSFIKQNVIKIDLNEWEYRLDGFKVCVYLFCNTIGH